jgi:hypothetical protein
MLFSCCHFERVGNFFGFLLKTITASSIIEKLEAISNYKGEQKAKDYQQCAAVKSRLMRHSDAFLSIIGVQGGLIIAAAKKTLHADQCLFLLYLSIPDLRVRQKATKKIK